MTLNNAAISDWPASCLLFFQWTPCCYLNKSCRFLTLSSSLYEYHCPQQQHVTTQNKTSVLYFILLHRGRLLVQKASFLAKQNSQTHFEGFATSNFTTMAWVAALHSLNYLKTFVGGDEVRIAVFTWCTSCLHCLIPRHDLLGLSTNFLHLLSPAQLECNFLYILDNF